MAVGGDQHVRWLDVAVQDPVLVQVGEAAQNRAHVPASKHSRNELMQS